MFISTVKYINYMMTKHTLQPFRSNPKTDVRGNLLLGDLMGLKQFLEVLWPLLYTQSQTHHSQTRGPNPGGNSLFLTGQRIHTEWDRQSC